MRSHRSKRESPERGGRTIPESGRTKTIPSHTRPAPEQRENQFEASPEPKIEASPEPKRITLEVAKTQ